MEPNQLVGWLFALLIVVLVIVVIFKLLGQA